MIDTALQMLLVITPDWLHVEGTLYRYQRSSPQENWNLVAKPIPIVVGKNGMVWGKHAERDLENWKREGDGKSPAGIFSLGPVFGDRAHQEIAMKMPFLPITADLEWVDDPHSQYYNQYVHASTITDRDWTSSELMAEIGYIYSIGVFVGHNIDPVEPGLGSCIFLHLWRNSKSGTGGCTAMEEEHLKEIVSWLDQSSQPCLVQLPYHEYASKKSHWKLPAIL